MTTEEKLKAYILTKYKSVREFTLQLDMPYSSVAAILKRGVANSSVSNIVKICRALNISTDELAEGKIVPLQNDNTERVELEKLCQLMTYKITSADEVTYNGKPLEKSQARLAIQGLELALKMIELES